MQSARIRHRQGAFTVIDGVPYPDKATTLSLLPNSLVGRWLSDNAAAVRGDLLDLGAGNQPFRPWYEPLARTVVAIDVAPADGLSLLSMASPLPFQDSSFDSVLCTSVLEHVDDAEQTIAEIERVLRPGGQLLISMPFLYPTHEAPYDFWRTTHYGLDRMLRRNGLQVGDIAAQGGPFMLVGHYLIGGLAQLIAMLGRRLGPAGWMIDNRLMRELIARPQEAIRARLSYRLTGLSRAASLGYMVVATKPR